VAQRWVSRLRSNPSKSDSATQMDSWNGRTNWFQAKRSIFIASRGRPAGHQPDRIGGDIAETAANAKTGAAAAATLRSRRAQRRRQASRVSKMCVRNLDAPPSVAQASLWGVTFRQSSLRPPHGRWANFVCRWADAASLKRARRWQPNSAELICIQARVSNLGENSIPRNAPFSPSTLMLWVN